MPSEFERLQAALPERYTLQRELDRGGASRVYLARESLPDRAVVIKVLDEGLSARLGPERFVREVDRTSKLQHPHILPIHAAGDADGMLYYVMPYVEGNSLRDRLDAEGPLPVADVVAIAVEVAEALQHAHDKGVLHRDVRPANILFQSGHAVVADFGVAQALEALEGVAGGAVPVLASPDYVSPEQAAGDGTPDARADLYSLGCVVYEMLAGQPPFYGRSEQATWAGRVDEPVPSLRARRSEVSSALAAVVERALARRPDDRHERVVDFADALRDAGRPEPAGRQRVAARPGLTGLVPEWVRPLRVVVALGITALALVTARFAVSMASADGPWEASVAVMPFENRTGNPEHDDLGQSMADQIIDRLTTVPEVRVIDPYTAVSLMNDSLGTPRLLDTLNVEHLIHGYIEARGDELVVNVSESDLGGFLSPRKQHRVDPERLAVAQVALANTVALAFLGKVGLEDRFDPGGSVIGPGRGAYLAGNAALGQRTPRGLAEAVVRFREAIALEPTSAAALSALSSAYALSLYYKYDVGVPSYELAARSLAAADSAVALDPDGANGFSARGYIRALIGIDIDEAEADFARAEELAPNAPNGPSWSARILARRGRIDEAFSEARRARDLDPLQAGRRTALASLGFQLGRYDVAIEESREAYRLEPRLSLARAFEGRALAMLDRGEECLDLDFGVYELVRALCLHSVGRTDDARTMIDRAARRLRVAGFGDDEHLPELPAQDLASYFGFIGDAERAAEWVRFAFERSPAGVDARLLGSELFLSVREDPEFRRAVDESHADARARVRALLTEVRPPL